MKGSSWIWFTLVAFVALAPAAGRMLTWERTRQRALDPAMVQAGETLFHHEWRAGDPLSAGGDGLGPVFNATSCVACHDQPGPGGAGGLERNVTTFVREQPGNLPPIEGVIHAFAVNCPPETLRNVDAQLPALTRPRLSQLESLANSSANSNMANGCALVPNRREAIVSQRNTPALYGDNLIDAIPDRVLIAEEKMQHLRWGLSLSERSKHVPVGRAMRLADGRVGHFGWKAQSASLASFVQAACANELGLGNPGQAQPRPLTKPAYDPSGYDLTLEQCDQITDFVASLPRPLEQLPSDPSQLEDVTDGKQLFHRVGCANCHTPQLGGVEGLYSDLLLHDMGVRLQGGGSYNEPPPQRRDVLASGAGPQMGEWRTPPLWGVADSAPYMHDGRAPTLEEAIQMHGGQGERSAGDFVRLSKTKQRKLLAFLQTLRAPS